MPDNNQNDNNQHANQPVAISSNTPIIFTVKSFFATVGSLLALLVGFYFTVLEPRIEKTEKYQKELYTQQQESFTIQIGNVKKAVDNNTTAIENNNKSIENVSKRFGDLNSAVEEFVESAGSFGSVVNSNTTDRSNDLVIN